MKASHFLVRQESGKEVSALAGLRPSFRFQRNRAGRSHAARVLLRARNSLRSFRGPARKPGPCRACARHFAFSETGRAGHTQYVCCFAPEIRCAHFGAALANPAPSVPLKNTNSNANNWRICVFLNASLRWPRTPACGPRAGLRPVGLGTRLRAQNGKRGGVFRRARNSKNDIRALTRCACAGKRDLE